MAKFTFAFILLFYFKLSAVRDPSSREGVNGGDHDLLDKTAMYGHVMGKIGLRKRGSLWTPHPHDLKYITFWDEHAHSALVVDATSFHGG